MTFSSHPLLPYRGLWSVDGLSGDDILSLFDAAWRWKAASLAGPVSGALDAAGGKPLLGKNIARLGPAHPVDETSTLYHAAVSLGARVATVRMDASLSPDDAEFHSTAQMLGRLYDAIDCAALAPALARQIERDAGVPVYNGLDRDEHLAAALADLMCLYVHGAKAGLSTTIRYRGDPGTARGAAFLHAAGLLDFTVHAFQSASTPEPQERPEPGTMTFTVDASNPGHWVLHAPSGIIGDAERAGNHRLILQTVLINTLAHA